MQVRKRNGQLEPVDVAKIVSSLKRYCELPNVDVYRIATKTINGLVDNVSTLELDLLSVRTAKDLIIDDPVYAKVAARILANIIQKEVAGQDIQSFSQSIETGAQQGLIAKTTYDLVMTNKRKLNAAVKHERDWFLEYHGLQTVYDRYLLKHPTLLNADKTTGKKQRAVIETPQYFLMRVACGLAVDAAEAVELYTLLSSLEYLCSTPTLFNSGTTHSQMSSCYLCDSPLDSLDDIYKRYGDIAMLSKFAGGIGVSMSRIRGKGSLIKGTNGYSDGMVPWTHTLSGSVAATNQGGRRKGAACVYLETHHPDIMQFLEMRDNTGAKENRAYNLNLANWVSDLFMQRVKDDAIWSLFDPVVAPELNDLYGDAYEHRYVELEAEGKYTEQLPARKLYARMMRTLAENGNGWMCFKDTCNRRANQVNDEAGTMVHLSNLCVAPETLILTRSGYTPIIDLADTAVEVWNGREWSETIVRKTGHDQKLITIIFDNGLSIDCTLYHKFYIEMADTCVVETRACELWEGAKLMKFVMPVIDDKDIAAMASRGSEGFTHVSEIIDIGRHGDTYCVDEPKRHMAVFNGILTGNCTEILEVTSSGEQQMMTREQVFDLTSEDMIDKSINILGFDTQTDRFEVLQGAEVAVCLAAGSPILTDDGYKPIEECDGAYVMVPFENDYEFTEAPRFIQATLIDNGVRPVWQIRLSNGNSLCATADHKLLVECIGNVRDWVTVDGLQVGMVLAAEGPMHDDDTATILSITPGGSEQVYDLYIPDAHHFVVAGIISHNCNLGSINIGRGYIRNGKLDKDKLHRNVAIAVKYLDRVIDRNFYPIPEARASNIRWRPVGLGLMGLADFFFQLRIPYDSEQAIALSSEIQEEIYFQALRTSCDLAKVAGPHRDFHLTRAAQGHLQFDLAGVVPKEPTRWDALRAEIMEHGLRNSLLLAGAPTACQIGTNAIRTNEGILSIYDILDQNKIPHQAVEDNNEQMWIPIEPIRVDTMNGPRTSDKIWFNGVQETYKVTYEDGTSYEYTKNHQLLVQCDGAHEWITVGELKDGDEVIAM